MTQEEKQLLLKDISARLPYGIMAYASEINKNGIITDVNIPYNMVNLTVDNGSGKYELVPLFDIKPYLRPMLSMTKEEYGQYMEFIEWSHNDYDGTVTTCINKELLHEYLDFIYSHHLDDNNLIGKGLALEAPEDMYKSE